MTNKKLTWKDFDKAVKNLSIKLKPLVPFTKNIYAVPKGGLVLGVALSHLLDVPLIFDKKKIGNGTIVVDDISDSGITLLQLLKDKQYLRTATLVTKSKTKFQPSYSYIVDVTDTWIIFPWENENTSKYDNL